VSRHKTLNNKKGKLIVISAPSGAGKSSLIKAIINNNNNIELSISATTRKPRGVKVMLKIISLFLMKNSIL